MSKLDVLSVGSNRTVGRACTGGRKVTREKTFLRVYVQLETKMFRSFVYLHLIEVGGVTDIFEL